MPDPLTDADLAAIEARWVPVPSDGICASTTAPRDSLAMQLSAPELVMAGLLDVPRLLDEVRRLRAAWTPPDRR